MKPDIPPEPPLPYRIWFHDLEHHATALGYVTMCFSQMEAQFRVILGRLLNVDLAESNAVFAATGNSLVPKCDLIEKLVRLRSADGAWTTQALAWVAAVKSIAEVRNRMIHDVWVAGPNEAHTIRVPSSPKLAGSEMVGTARPLEEIWGLVREIQNATVTATVLAFSMPQR